MHLFFIRHGQTDWNQNNKIQGSQDIELNAAGIEQAENLNNKIKELNYKFSKIYTSKQKRAFKTASILSQKTNIDFIPIEGIEEINFGKWEGMSWENVENQFPTEYKKWSNNRGYAKPPEGESYQDLLERVLVTIHNIIEENSNNVAIVTHSAVIMCL
ncbi:MAG: histidine phosphatase family protein [Lachnotalea sp.]